MRGMYLCKGRQTDKGVYNIKEFFIRPGRDSIPHPSNEIAANIPNETN